MHDVFIHPTAMIDEGAKIGAKCTIWHFSHIMSGASLGDSCNIGQNVMVAPRVIIGNNVKIQNNVSVYEGVVCEDDVFLGPSCVFGTYGIAVCPESGIRYVKRGNMVLEYE